MVTLWECKINQILRHNWQLEQARWCSLIRLELAAVSHGKKFPKAINIIKKIILYWPSLFGQDGWILALFFFCKLRDQDRDAMKGLGQYPAFLISRLVENHAKNHPKLQ